MHLRWLLIATFTMLLAPSIASARHYPPGSIQDMEDEGKGDPTSLVVDAPTPPLYRCGLRAPVYEPPPPRKPSKLPYVLSIAGLLAAFALRERAGTDEVHVPDCLP